MKATNSFDVVAVGIQNKGGVVVGIVIRADAGCAVVLAAGLDGAAVKFVDLFSIRRLKGDVGM